MGIRLAPLRFSDDASEDVHELLLSFLERLHNLDLVELHGVDYNAFQMEGPAKQQWRSYLECMPFGTFIDFGLVL